jgi:chromosomal replication initiator protein DnaA
MLKWRKNSKEPEVEEKSPPTDNKGSSRAHRVSAEGKDVAKGAESSAQAAQGQVQHPRKKLGQILVEAGVVTPGQLEEALKKREQTGGFLGKILVDLGYIESQGLISFLVKQCKIPHINLSDYEISEPILKLLPEEVCLRYHLLPIDKLGKILTVAMVDPLDIEALEEIRAVCPDLRIKPILCTWEHFAVVSDRLFESKDAHAEEMSASSFGLSDKAPKKKSAPQAARDQRPKSDQTDAVDAAVDALVSAGDATEGSKASSAEKAKKTAPKASKETAEPRDTPPAAIPDAAEFTKAVRSGLHDAAREAFESFAAQTAGTSASQPAAASAEELAEAMRDTLKEALGDAMSGIVGSLQGMQHAELGADAQQALAQQAAESAKSAELLREAVAAMQEAMKRAPSDGAAAPSGPSAEELAATLGETLQESLGQALSGLVDRLGENGQAQANGEVQGLLTRQSSDAASSAEAVREAIESMTQAQAAQHEQMAELTEAATRAATVVEEALRASQEAKAAPALPQELQDNVHTFPGAAARMDVAKEGQASKAELDALEALDGPGMRVRADDRVRAALKSESPLPGYIFGEYFGGEANSFTVTLAQAVAAQPGSQYSPLFVCGEVGLGKTHLINAIGNNVLAREPDARIGYISANMFARKFAEADKTDKIDAFRERYSCWDMLILDDIQSLATRQEAQEELCHIFNALHQEKRQLIIAGDKPPDRLEGLDKRLTSRFCSGVVASVRPPEHEARVQILQHIVALSESTVPEAIVTMIATQIPDDMRKMAGALRKVIAFARLVDQEITGDLAVEILSHLGVKAA